jgi:hypothetical protein
MCMFIGFLSVTYVIESNDIMIMNSEYGGRGMKMSYSILRFFL